MLIFSQLMTRNGRHRAVVPFIGDELFDIPVMKAVGFSATVPHAPEEVKREANYVTDHAGGWGAVREIADMIRAAGPAPGLTPTTVSAPSGALKGTV